MFGTYADRPAVKANGTVSPSAKPMMASRTKSLWEEWCSWCGGPCGIAILLLGVVTVLVLPVTVSEDLSESFWLLWDTGTDLISFDNNGRLFIDCSHDIWSFLVVCWRKSNQKRLEGKAWKKAWRTDPQKKLNWGNGIERGWRQWV